MQIEIEKLNTLIQVTKKAKNYLNKEDPGKGEFSLKVILKELWEGEGKSWNEMSRLERGGLLTLISLMLGHINYDFKTGEINVL